MEGCGKRVRRRGDGMSTKRRTGYIEVLYPGRFTTLPVFIFRRTV
jgi:hypothetical protein